LLPFGQLVIYNLRLRSDIQGIASNCQQFTVRNSSQQFATVRNSSPRSPSPHLHPKNQPSTASKLPCPQTSPGTSGRRISVTRWRPSRQRCAPTSHPAHPSVLLPLAHRVTPRNFALLPRPFIFFGVLLMLLEVLQMLTGHHLVVHDKDVLRVALTSISGFSAKFSPGNKMEVL
jgi:hypothetical protein